MAITLPNAAIATPDVETYYDPVQGMRRQLRWALILIAFLVVGLGGAAILVPMRGAVVAQGQIGVESRVKKVAHWAGGTVAEIRVKNGQRVRKGQILVRLDSKVSDSAALQSALSVDQLLAQKARLEAEQLATSISFPRELLDRADDGARRAMTDERRMYALRRQEMAGLESQASARISQYQDQIMGYQAQIAALEQQSKLIQPEREGLQTLFAKKLVTIARLNQMERTAADIKGSIGMLTAQIAQARSQIAETRAQTIQLAQSRRSEAGNQLAQVNDQLNQQRSHAVSSSDERDRSVIRAPSDGVVEQLALTTIGGVIRPAETIMEIVPDHDRMIVEGAVSPSDIDQLRIGQGARIALPGLSRAVTMELSGTVIYVGADHIVDPDGKTYYPVRVAMNPSALRTLKSAGLRPGMPTELFITTGDRSMMSYITKPLRDQFARSFLDGA